MAKWARFFHVSQSGYYSYIKRHEQRLRDEAAFKEEIKRIFKESGGTYGPNRIRGALRQKGKKASYRKVSRFMSDMGLQSIYNRHKKTRSLTDSRESRGEGFPNLLRGKVFERPKMAVVSDITYLRSEEGWLYHCVVKDIVSGEILGESSGERVKKELVITAFLNAQSRRNFAPGAIFHSDRGSQYTSHEFMETLKVYGIKQSFSRVGMPGDNAWAESFFATLKKECIHHRHFKTREELAQTVFAWINGFYNTRRVQARLGYLPPKAYAAMMLLEHERSAA